MNQKIARNLKSLEDQFEKIRIKLEKYKDVAPDDINRTIVDELFDKIVIEPSDKTKATLAFHLRNGDIENGDFLDVVLKIQH